MAFEDRIQDSAMSDFVLQNGMEEVVVPDHRMPIVTQMVRYKAGAADGPSGKSGIAHFLEHLIFKGTKTHKGGEFDKAVSETGGEENAFTSFDYTAFYQTVAPEALSTMMESEADRMRHIDLSEAAVATERDVTVEDLQLVAKRPLGTDPAVMIVGPVL
ncbi:putative Zn-dependent peptidase [Rhizobium mesoamericanum]|uniref:M16 family metallopeptidase n=1 Tax=Rhizobium mesoamericanum TaxID=1079800 RepID=UPI002783752C|nr:insulinase family protein [Rhizobium mesoamericanum]MDQ0562307.1 putative Zn-dependent peptidase [Rhizobium mesoamericanum]